jgi:hypothetical protein
MSGEKLAAIELEHRLALAEKHNANLRRQVSIYEKALLYYSEELPWREVMQTRNWCDDYCDIHCNKHSEQVKTRIRSAAHNRDVAKEALEEGRK